MALNFLLKMNQTSRHVWGIWLIIIILTGQTLAFLIILLSIIIRPSELDVPLGWLESVAGVECHWQLINFIKLINTTINYCHNPASNESLLTGWRGHGSPHKSINSLEVTYTLSQSPDLIRKSAGSFLTPFEPLEIVHWTFKSLHFELVNREGRVLWVTHLITWHLIHL